MLQSSSTCPHLWDDNGVPVIVEESDKRYRSGGGDGSTLAMSEARIVVRKFRAEPLLGPFSDIAASALKRLEADPHGRISAALHRLGGSPLLLFYLVQAIDLAISRNDVMSESTEWANQYRRLAEYTRYLVKAVQGHVERSLWATLPDLALALDGRVQLFDENARKLQLNRKRRGEAAPQLVALRHFFRRLGESGIQHSTKGQKEAVCWLVEIALDCHVPPSRVTQALRRSHGGIRSPRKHAENPNRLKALKNR